MRCYHLAVISSLDSAELKLRRAAEHLDAIKTCIAVETLPMWTNVQPQLQPHPFRMKISKLGNQMEGRRRSIDSFSNLID